MQIDLTFKFGDGQEHFSHDGGTLPIEKQSIVSFRVGLNAIDPSMASFTSARACLTKLCTFCNSSIS
jgi:hypothetical protein